MVKSSYLRFGACAETGGGGARRENGGGDLDTPRPARRLWLVNEARDTGYETSEEAARGDMPPEFVTVIGSRVAGDSATVWLLTNDRPPFEPYAVHCERRNGRWYWESGSGGFGRGTPDGVLETARRFGWL